MLDAEQRPREGGRGSRPRPGGRRRSDRGGVPRRALRRGAPRGRRPRRREPGGAARPRAPRLQSATEAADYVHLGATSQDIVDTAAMLVSRRAVALVLAELDRLADGCAALARAHRSTPMAARTLLQQAVPTTFGLKAAGWLVAVLEARGETRRRPRRAARRAARRCRGNPRRPRRRRTRGRPALRRGARARGAPAPLAHEPPAPRGARRGTGRRRGRGREGRPRHRAPGAERGGRGRRGVGRAVLDDAAEAQSRSLHPRGGVCAPGERARGSPARRARSRARARGRRLARRVGGALRCARVRGRSGSGRRGRRHRPRGRRRADAREPRCERRPRRRGAHLVRPHAPPRAQPGARARRRGRAALRRSATRCWPTRGQGSPRTSSTSLLDPIGYLGAAEVLVDRALGEYEGARR